MRNAMLVVLLALPVAWFAFGRAEKPKLPEKDALDCEQIGKILKDLGYEPQSLSETVHQVSVNREGWKVHIMVSATSESDRLWFECKFAPIPQPEIVQASSWLKLLEENERIGPAYFSFDKSDKRIHLYKAIDNVGVTPARLKKELDALDAIVRRTQNIWRIENFQPIETLPVVPRAVEEPKKPVSFDGKWRIVRFETKGESITEEQLAAMKLHVSIAADQAVIKMGNVPERKLRVKLDASKMPQQIDFLDDKDGKAEAGIYFVEAGLLTICLAGPSEDRPRQFATDPKNKHWLVVLKSTE